MPEFSKTFQEQLPRVWGHSAAVADAAMNELFRHEGSFNLDYDDQAEYAKQIGLIAGETRDQSMEVFLQRFNDEVFHPKGSTDEEESEG